jgi:hypothetical protein
MSAASSMRLASRSIVPAALDDGKVGVLRPRGEVGDREAVHRESEGTGNGVGDGLDDELLLGVVESQVVGLGGEQGVGELVDEGVDAVVGRLAFGEPDRLVGGAVVAAVAGGHRLVRDRAPELGGKLREWVEDPGEVVAVDLMDRRIERQRLGRRGQLADLASVEDGPEPEPSLGALLGVGAGVLPVLELLG